MKIIDSFEIPEELAQELSDLLTKQTIRDRVLMNLVDDPVKFEEAEKMLIPITAKIEAIKAQITKEFVPSKYNDARYSWNYEGFMVSGNRVDILE